MTILLTLSVYQLMIQDHLPKKSGAVPIIGLHNMHINYIQLNANSIILQHRIVL